MVVGNGNEEQGAANTPPKSHTVPQPLLPTPGETRKRFTDLSSAETPAKKRRYGPLSEPYAQPIQSFPPPSCNSCNSLSSSEPAQTREHCALGVALIPDEQVEKHNKEGKTSAQHNYFPVCRCNDRVPKTWKLFVEDESLVPLDEALYYLATSKLGDFDVCVEHRIKLALKLQLRQVDTLTLLTRVDSIWRNRDSETLKRFVNMKCRQKWWQFDGKVLGNETAVTEFQIIRDREGNKHMENVTESLVSRLLPSNIDERLPDNLFAPENIPTPTSLIATPNIPSLHTKNSLESTKSAWNQGKPSRDYFEGLPLANALQKYDAKTILDITPVASVHALFHALENNDPVAQQIAKVPVLLPKRDGESVAKSMYRLNDGPLGFPLCIDLLAMSTFCGQEFLSQTAVEAALSLMCNPSPGIQILSVTSLSDSQQKKYSATEYFTRHNIDTILLPALFKYHCVAVSLSVNGEKIIVTIYDSMKRLHKKLRKPVFDTVSKLPFYTNSEECKFRTGECSQQIAINDCGIHTIANLVSLAQKQEPSTTPLDCKELRRVYAEACCKAFVAI